MTAAWVQLAVLGLLIAALVASAQQLARQTAELTWLLVGATGQALWLARYALQWRHAERAGRSSLPASFWRAGLAGSNRSQIV